MYSDVHYCRKIQKLIHPNYVKLKPLKTKNGMTSQRLIQCFNLYKLITKYQNYEIK